MNKLNRSVHVDKDQLINKDHVNVTEVQILTQESYDRLEKQIGRICVGHETTQLETAFQLGQQSVLKILRDGYVVGKR